MPTENGWEPHHAPANMLEWVRIPGAEHVSLQFLKGWPSTILRAFAADYHAYIEPLRDADSAAFTATNSVATSNHLNGTAMDLNWNGPDGKTFRLGISEERAYPGDKARNLRELLAFYSFEGLQIVFCGGKWSIRDWMHFQMGGNTWKNPKVLRFIEQRIRADGFSTYKRGGTTPPSDAAPVLAQATGLSLARATEILPAVSDGLRQSDCTNTNRIAMWLAQCGHESAGFNATEEYQNGPMDQERWIYKGRTWIQLTWRSAYEGFGKWCHARGLVSDPNVFVNNPKSLADLRWAGLGAAYYWTTTRRESRKYPTLNEASDARDLLVATQIINGGTNGLPDRQNRYNRALGLGDQLLALTTGGDELTPEQDKMLREVWGCLFNPIPSQSKYKVGGEGKRWRLHELIKNDDAMIHEMLVERQAMAGNEEAIALVKREADKGDPWATVIYEYITSEDIA